MEMQVTSPATTIEAPRTSPNISLLVRGDNGELFFISSEAMKQFRLENAEEVAEKLGLDDHNGIFAYPEEAPVQQLAIDVSKSLITQASLEDVGLTSSTPGFFFINGVVNSNQRNEEE